MSNNKFNITFILAAFVVLAVTTSCSTQPSQPPYDPSKNYAAFLVLKSPNAVATLEEIKGISQEDSYEIGPVEYYSAGITDFEPVLRRLTSSKQITLLWVAGNLMDVANIQKGVTKVSFKGKIRYAKTASAPGGPSLGQ